MIVGIRGTLITVALAIVAGFGGVWLGKTVFDRTPHQTTLHDVVHHQLRLDAEQRRRIDVLDRNFAVQRHALELEMRAANVDLAIAIREEQGYGPRVVAAVDRFHAAMGRLQTETIQHVFAMREVLRQDQKATFDDTVVSALTSETR